MGFIRRLTVSKLGFRFRFRHWLAVYGTRLLQTINSPGPSPSSVGLQVTLLANFRIQSPHSNNPVVRACRQHILGPIDTADFAFLSRQFNTSRVRQYWWESACCLGHVEEKRRGSLVCPRTSTDQGPSIWGERQANPEGVGIHIWVLECPFLRQWKERGCGVGVHARIHT